jgi:hypothetical protein
MHRLFNYIQSRGVSRKSPRHLPPSPMPPPRRHHHHICNSSSSGEPEPSAGLLSLQDAYETLGVKEGATSDDVIAAKNRLLSRHNDNEPKRAQIETAYDVIFMHLMKARLSGELPVSARVRFADVVSSPKRKSSSSDRSSSRQQPPRQLPGGLLLQPFSDQQTSTTSGAIFAALLTWSMIQALAEPPSMAAVDVPGLQIALGSAASVYLLREKKKATLPRALGITFLGLLVGTLAGGLVETWLRVDIVPIGSFNSPGVLVGEFSIAGLLASCLLLA